MATAIWTFSVPNNACEANQESKIYIFYGDGEGNFTKTIVDQGYDLHEAKIADLNGDGRLDILGKPYDYQTPRLDIWLNQPK